MPNTIMAIAPQKSGTAAERLRAPLSLFVAEPAVVSELPEDDEEVELAAVEVVLATATPL